MDQRIQRDFPKESQADKGQEGDPGCYVSWGVLANFHSPIPLPLPPAPTTTNPPPPDPLPVSSDARINISALDLENECMVGREG